MRFIHLPSLLSLFLSLFLICTIGLGNMQAQVSKQLIQRKDGKYILQFKGKLYQLYVRNEDPNKNNQLKTNRLPVGVQVKIINPKNGKSVEVKVADSVKYLFEGYIAEASPDILQKLFTGRNDYLRVQVMLEYITPIDQLLKSIYEASNPDEKIIRFKALLPVLQQSLPTNPANIPGLDSLSKFAATLSTSRKKELYPAMISFFENIKPQSALFYLKTLIQIYQSENNKDKEAEYWLRLGDAVNALVDKQVVKQKSPSDEALRDPQIIAEKVAEKTGYPVLDVIRWNWFGGYYPTNYLFYAEPEFELFPHPEQFSDKEYLEYLKIQQAQNQPDKIAWALKKLGDLHRLKTGYKKAEEYYFQMEKLRAKGADKDKLAWVWGHLARFYWEQKKYPLAENYFNKIYQLRTQTKDYKRVIWALGGLRYLRYTQGKLDEALAYQRKILVYYEQLGRKQRGLLLYSVIANYLWVFPQKKQMIKNYLAKWAKEYQDNPKLSKKYYQQSMIITEKLAQFAQEEQKFEEAAQYLQSSISAIKDSIIQLSTINDVAFYYQQAKKYRKSIKFYKLGLKKTKRIPNKFYKGLQYYKIGYYYEYQQNTKKALKQFRKSLQVFKTLPDNSATDYYRQTNYLERAARFLAYQKKYREVGIPLLQQFIRIIKRPQDKFRLRNFLQRLQRE